MRERRQLPPTITVTIRRHREKEGRKPQKSQAYLERGIKKGRRRGVDVPPL